jgi:hypothetical protein
MSARSAGSRLTGGFDDGGGAPGPVGAPGPDGPPGLAAVLDSVGRAVGREPSALTAEQRVVDVCHDSLDLYCLYVALDEWVPGFRLPSQLDLEIATLADVHHYLQVRFEQRRA